MGFYRTNLTASGQPDPTFSRVIDGTTNLSIVNLGGFPLLSITWNVTNGVILSQETYSNFDSFGRPQRVTHLDGTYEDTYYACCGIETTIDRDGVPTQYWHDAMKRQTATTRLGITATNVLDAPGRVDRLAAYRSTGKRAYRLAATLEPADADIERLLLERLSDDYDLCVKGLAEVRRIWGEG